MKNEIKKFLAYNGRVSITCAMTTELVDEARKIHDLTPVSTAALGRLITMATIMGTDLKDEEDNITLQIKGNGPIGTMVAVVNGKMNVKATVGNPYVDVPLNEFGKLDVGMAVGNDGFLNVIKDLGLKKPYIGIVPLSSGEIAEDFARYFTESEQTKSAVALGVLVNKDGVKSAGGYLVSAMPDATEEDIMKLEKNIFEAGAISRMLDEGLSLYEIARKITGDKDIKIIQENINAKYECDCSEEKMKKALSTIGKKQLKEILEEDGKAEMTCHFCNKKYIVSKQDLEKIIKNLKEENKIIEFPNKNKR